MFHGDAMPPGGLFQYDHLEKLVSEDLGGLIEVIDDGLGDVDDRGLAFIDESFELERPDSATYSNALSLVLADDGEIEAARLAGYRAFHFAHTVSSLVLSAPTGMRTNWFYDDIQDAAYLREKLTNASHDYLSSRNSLDTIIRRFMPELDPTDLYPHVAEIIAGTTFMFIDEAEKVRVINEQIANFSVDLDEFDIKDW